MNFTRLAKPAMRLMTISILFREEQMRLVILRRFRLRIKITVLRIALLLVEIPSSQSPVLFKDALNTSDKIDL